MSRNCSLAETRILEKQNWKILLLERLHLNVIADIRVTLTLTSPLIDHADLIVHRSDRSGCVGLGVTVFELPACARFDSALETNTDRNTYAFGYRPRIERGNTLVTLPALGVAERRVSREDVLLVPPKVRVSGEWVNAAGRTARFVFVPDFLESIAAKLGVPPKILRAPSTACFLIDQQLESLCRLLMEETENNCRLGPLYFDPLAHSLAVAMLIQIRDRDAANQRIAAVPAGIRRAIQRLEDDYATEICLADLTDEARLSRQQFDRKFQKATGLAPHQYLLRVRLSHARALIAKKRGAVTLADVATSCGFYDQTHFGKHFRRVFGMTPGAFLRAQKIALSEAASPDRRCSQRDPEILASRRSEARPR
jgi:AraC-like DNA-binding protein